MSRLKYLAFENIKETPRKYRQISQIFWGVRVCGDWFSATYRCNVRGRISCFAARRQQ